ncbi:glycosyltransferase family 4 protein [Arthrobacter sp. C152]
MNHSKLKITIIGLHYAPEPSGNAPYTTSLAEGLSQRGHDVTVVTGYPHYPEWSVHSGYRGWSIKQSLNGVSVKRLRHFVPQHPSTLGRLHMEFSFGVRVLATNWHKPDVVVLVSPALFSSGLALLRARLLGRQKGTIIWVQDIYSRGIVETGGKPGFVSRAMALVERKVLGSVDAVVAIHDRFARYISEGLQVQPDSVHVVRNWTHLPPSRPVDREAVRQKLGWNATDIVALHSGNIGKKQGLGNVVEAARLAESTGSRVKFVLMGDGNQRTTLETSAKGLKQIEFVDALPQADFQAALEAADVLLVNELPGVRDMSVPSKLTSYFTSGRPVLAATDEGSVTAEEIGNSGAGIRVDAGDPAALVTAAESLGENADFASSLGKQGRIFREKTLSETFAVGRYDDLITSLALSRGR